MFKKILKQIKFYRFEIITSLGIFITYFFTRLYQLKYVPIFLDELIYGRWAQIGFYDPSLRLASLSDGKQPLFIWLVSLMMNIIHNPVMAARIVSVLAGFGTIVGLFILTRQLFKNTWIAFCAAFLYVIIPATVFFNRMGLYESLVGLLLVWTIYLEVLLIRYVRLDVALLLGLLFGANILSKSSAMFVVYLLPISVLLNIGLVKHKKQSVKWIGLCVLAIVLGFLYASVLHLSPHANQIAEKNSQFVYSLNELIPNHAFSSWIKNMGIFLGWTAMLITIPVLFLVLLSFFVKSRYLLKEKMFLFLWFLLPFLALSLFGKQIFPRYIFVMQLMLLPLAGYGIVFFIKKAKSISLALLIFFISISCAVYGDFKILTDVSHAPLPKETIYQHINGWPSGEGVHKMIEYLTTAANSGPIFIATEGIYGSVPSLATEIYFLNNANVQSKAFDTMSGTIPPELLEKAQTMPVYIFMNKTQIRPNWPMTLVLEHRKGSGNEYMRLYQLQKFQ